MPGQINSHAPDRVILDEATNELPDVSQLDQVHEIFKCSGCGCNLMEDNFRYTATTSGTEYGRAWINENGDEETELHDSGNDETDDWEYRCDNCDNEETNKFHKITTFLQVLNREYLENEANRIQDTRRRNRGFGAYTLNAEGHAEMTPQEQETYMRKRKVFDTWEDDEGETYKIYHKEVFDHLKQQALGGHIDFFNWEHPAYKETPVEAPVEAPVIQPPEPEDEDPEMHSMVGEEHHQRWWRYCKFPDGVCECPIENCKHGFVINPDELRHGEDITCPKCLRDFNPFDDTLSDDSEERVTIRLNN